MNQFKENLNVHFTYIKMHYLFKDMKYIELIQCFFYHQVCKQPLLPQTGIQGTRCGVGLCF